MIYLASPYSHEDEDVRQQRFDDVCEATVAYMKAGYLIYSPIAASHPLAQFGDLPTDWEYWREYDTEIIRVCKELWVLMLDGWKESKGVQAEIEIAKGLGIPVEYVSMTVAAQDDGSEEAYREHTTPYSL